ncbi:hypothetical protein SAMN05446037_10302 [Anaerovirgula multivorans]|uniref:Peptidoglycan binding domain-containing protein n=1 Tax=Anaerovirgula multivorans TaxID=312168 RepID=A0A239IRR1_9FIRM|nr:hypothetical protein [Anaerovirgula multivorans]SNS95908.1 hypothetical protein SAMN05446037_10302 [Anaerovirgula multivorans]
MKKIISLCLIFILLLVSTFTSSANSLQILEVDNISSETIITEDNIYNVLDYLDIAQNDFVKSDEPMTDYKITTVGELQEAIEEFKQKSTIVVEDNVNNIKTKFNDEEDFNVMRNPVATVYFDAERLYCTVRHLAYGEYSGTSWVRATGGDIRIVSDEFGYTSSISVDKCITSLQGSYLKLEYEYTIESYLVIQWGLLKVGEQDFEGYRNFRVSDI